MKLCVDCKWHVGENDPRYDKCIHPKNMELNLVTGEQSARWIYCSTHREDAGLIWAYLFRCCGERGRWFEPKS